ncbi:MAG: tryptophan synthase subunit alpha [Anaerolineae bacterium]|nr:tryptophan synthase subunit alpha [Anaerolineae bacterium]MDW8173117.1 tryptophan synthase subunit alpha [Anaerolineae bacterium]
MSRVSGLAALEAMFERSKAEGRAAFLPYFPIGYPDYETSLAVIQAMAEVGVDGFEIGVPFSDPLADGPMIQMATQKALENGTTVRKCLQAVRELRRCGLDQPMLMMSYANPLLAYGAERFVADAQAAGADGVIVPDLPPEEAHYFARACQQAQMCQVFMLAPTSDEQRIRLVAERATGFIYVVSLTGVTGARAELPADLTDFIGRIRQHTQTPLVLGFGISQPHHARQMNGLVEGFIVGSAVVRAAGQGVDAVRDLAHSLRTALVNS